MKGQVTQKWVLTINILPNDLTKNQIQKHMNNEVYPLQMYLPRGRVWHNEIDRNSGFATFLHGKNQINGQIRCTYERILFRKDYQF